MSTKKETQELLVQQKNQREADGAKIPSFAYKVLLNNTGLKKNEKPEGAFFF